jgi:hypothetical protein
MFPDFKMYYIPTIIKKHKGHKNRHTDKWN